MGGIPATGGEDWWAGPVWDATTGQLTATFKAGVAARH
jgi:hypothetical protein